MSGFKDWCENVMPFVIASSSGEVVQASCDNGNSWFDMDECEMSDPALQFDFGDYDYRIKPRTIKIGDFDVPEPMRVEPGSGVQYFVVETLSDTPAACQTWNGMDCEKRWLSMGLCHKSKESAIAHAKALIALTSAK